MKRIIIEQSSIKESDLIDYIGSDTYMRLMGEYKIMESHIIYFSAGDAKIKEIMIKREPHYSI
jgi:hypothetical protein